MPIRAPWICGCGHKIAGGASCPCQRRRKVAVEKSRPSARQRGYDTRWERASAEFLARPENKRCACGCGQPATMVDHKIAHKGDMRLFWDRSNWQPMSRRCNSRKAASREGGFGNPTRAGMAMQ
jgi:5-methylcytosine-specific restriction protein A